MEFISNKIEELKKIQDKDRLVNEMLLTIEKLANGYDILVNKVNELEEINESLELNLRDVQQIILKNFDFEDIHTDDEDCDCGHCNGDCQDCDEECDDARPDSFYTLQCPFCEELFFIERDELDQAIECPFCGKEVKAVDNLVKP